MVLNGCVNAKKVMKTKIDKEIKKLKEVDIERVKIENRVRIDQETSEKYNHISNKRVRDLAHFVENIKDADIVDLNYLGEIIEDQKREKAELSRKHPPLRRFLYTSSQSSEPTKPGYLVKKTLADHFQQKYKLTTDYSLLENQSQYLSKLFEIRESTAPEPRSLRSKLSIYIVDQNIGWELRHSKSIKPRNGRTPFANYSDVDYSDPDFTVQKEEIEDLTKEEPKRTLTKAEIRAEKEANEFNKKLKEKLDKGPFIVSFIPNPSRL